VEVVSMYLMTSSDRESRQNSATLFEGKGLKMTMKMKYMNIRTSCREF
jgi:hypothetical protein